MWDILRGNKYLTKTLDNLKISQYVAKYKLQSVSLTTNHEVPGSIAGSTMGIFLVGEDPRGDHGQGS